MTGPDNPVAPLSSRQTSGSQRGHPSKSLTSFKKADVEQSIPARFEEIVRKFSNRVAIKTDNQDATYAELNAMANRLARCILAERGNRAEPVGLLLEKDVSLMVAMIAILKAGKFFVLIDPSLPKARIAATLRDSRADLTVTDRHNVLLARETRGSCQLIEIESVAAGVCPDDLRLLISPQELAYVIYTSGSTGEPKGVMQSHQNLLHRMLLRANAHHVHEEDRIALLPNGTSNAVTTIFLALLNGALLLPFDVKKEGAARLADWLSEERISICLISSTLFRGLCDALTGSERFPCLRDLRLRSEAVYRSDVDLYKKFFPASCLLVNGLSSSETGPLTEYLINHSTQISGNDVPIGYAFPDKEILLLNDAGEQLGVNQVGEIAVRSRYLSPGYWEKPDLTETKFKTDSTGGNERLYLTGDLAMMLPDGCLIYKGRKDFRIKVRGYGVDLVEVEKSLRAHPAIREAVVVQRQNESGETYLIGYFTSVGAGPSVGELRSFLNQKLADYMIPSAFVMLENIPLTSNGKIDRAALPDPKHSRADLATAWMAPKTRTEQQLVKIWEDTLEIRPIGVNDDFFELGGHSLLGSRVLSQMHEALEVDLPLRTLFESPTVALLAKRIDGADEGSQDRAENRYGGLIPLHRVPGDKRIFCFPYRGGFRDEYFNFTRISRHATRDYSFFGLESRDLEPEGQPRRRIEEIGTDCREAMQRLQPHGPYCLVGECGGGILAHEVAQQLRERGEKVPLLVLLDTHAWSFGSYIWRRLNENRRYRQRFGLGRRRYRMPWILNYFRARTKFHLEALRQLKGSNRWRYFLNKAGHAVAAVTYSLQRQTSPNSHPATPRLTERTTDDLDPVEKAYYVASHRHRFRRYDGKIVLLVNEEWYANDPTLGWNKFAAGGLEIHKIPGNHDNCIPDNIPLVAKLLNECLVKANPM